MSEQSLKAAFAMLSREIQNVKSSADLTEDVISAMWSMSIFSSVEYLRLKSESNVDEAELLQLARMMALKHFDRAVSDNYEEDPMKFFLPQKSQVN